MIFVKYYPESDSLDIWGMPFHPQHGLGKTEEELLSEGYLLDGIPAAEPPAGSIGVLKFDLKTEKLYYDYTDRPLTPEEEIQQLKSELAVSKEDNISNMLAITELYEMLLGGTA
jgi:hypothetical protein